MWLCVTCGSGYVADGQNSCPRPWLDHYQPFPPPQNSHSGATYDEVKKYGQFEDADFLAEINASDEDKNVKIKQYLREEAVVPWKTYSELTDRIHY